MLLRALGLLLLLDGGDDTPRGTAGTDDVLVRDRQQVALVDSELAANLERWLITRLVLHARGQSGVVSYVGDFLFDC